MLEHDIKSYEKRFASFGWVTISIDGHNLAEIIRALTKAKSQNKTPTVILAKTLKGKSFGDKIENELDWHGKDMG